MDSSLIPAADFEQKHDMNIKKRYDFSKYMYTTKILFYQKTFLIKTSSY